MFIGYFPSGGWFKLEPPTFARRARFRDRLWFNLTGGSRNLCSSFRANRAAMRDFTLSGGRNPLLRRRSHDGQRAAHGLSGCDKGRRFAPE
jgi:hypothetical protein